MRGVASSFLTGRPGRIRLFVRASPPSVRGLVSNPPARGPRRLSSNSPAATARGLIGGNKGGPSCPSRVVCSFGSSSSLVSPRLTLGVGPASSKPTQVGCFSPRGTTRHSGQCKSWSPTWQTEWRFVHRCTWPRSALSPRQNTPRAHTSIDSVSPRCHVHSADCSTEPCSATRCTVTSALLPATPPASSVTSSKTSPTITLRADADAGRP